MSRMLSVTMPFLSLLVLFCGCGCGKTQQRAEGEHIYPRIMNHKMELRIISSRGGYYAGETTPVMRFQLYNNGMNTISIPDWRANGPQNIRIEYAPCRPGESASVTQWTSCPDTGKKVPWNYPLELKPKNSTIVEVPLDFIRTLKQKGNYAVRGVLTLHSLPLESPAVEILVE